jgi:hypothetical protein
MSGHVVERRTAEIQVLHRCATRPVRFSINTSTIVSVARGVVATVIAGRWLQAKGRKAVWQLWRVAKRFLHQR